MSTQDLGQYIPAVRQNGIRLNANEPLVAAGTATFSGTETHTGGVTFSGTVTLPTNPNQNAPVGQHTPVAINSTASVTASQLASGYLTSTSGAAVTMTLPSATAIAAVLNAVQGTTFDLYIDNTAGANTVTITPDSSMVKAQVAQVATYGVPTFGLFTVASGTSGLGCFKLVFSSATALSISRVF